MNNRFLCAYDYLITLEKSLYKGWAGFYSESGGSLTEKLVLLHPEHLRQLDFPSHIDVDSLRVDIQGKRSFIEEATGICCAELLWGYKCNLKGKIHNDHLFPYSLGGPTIGTNRVSLCEFHNSLKSSDIHCFPWEDSETRIIPWLNNQLEKVKRKVFDSYNL